MKSPRLATPPADEETATSDDATAERWRQLVLQGAVIVLAGLWIYSPAYHGDWLWDDDQLLTANPVVQSGSLSGLAKLWFNPDGADFFPLSYTALWAQWPFFKLTSTGYHVTSILLHIASALLVWALFARMRIPGAWFGGLLFAIHPICVESVAWVSETKNTLSMPLFLLSCLCWVGQDEALEDEQRQNRLYGLAILFFLLAMLAKTSMVAYPVVLLLYAWWKRGKVTMDDVVRALPFFVISVVLGIITIQYQHGRAIGAEKIPVGGAASRIATAGMAILFYLWQIVWPVHPMPIYPRWEVDPPKVWQFLPWPVILGTAAWLWNRRGTARRPGWERHALFGLGFFLLMVAPVLGFVTISYMRITWVADHFVYLPLLGPVALAAAGLARVYEAAGARVASAGGERPLVKPSASRPLLIAATTIALAAFAIRSFIYAHAWAGEDPLWNYTLKLNHDAWQAHNRLGARKFSRGDIDGAFYHFTHSTRLRPDLGETHNNLGTALSAKGRLDDAIKEFAEASRLIPDNLTMLLNLANALYQRGRFREAADTFGRMIEIQRKTTRSDNPALLNNYAVALYRAGDKNAAIANFRRALELNPDLKDARDGLAVALGEKPDPALQKPQAEAPPQPPAPATGAGPFLPGQSTLGPTPLVPQAR